MADPSNKGKGIMYKFLDKKCVELIDDIYIFNGCILSNDQTKFYFVDSARNEIQVCNYKDGNILSRETFFKPASYPELGGVFDGASFNKAGNMWWAIYGGSKIILINTTTGFVEKVVEI